MAIINITTTENKWLIFFDNDYPSYYFDSALKQLTTFDDSCWVLGFWSLELHRQTQINK
jgi:hypothetical protein